MLTFAGVAALAACFPERPSPQGSVQTGASQHEAAPERGLAKPGPIPTPLVEIQLPPAPPPEPPAFVGRETVRVDELLAALREELARVAESPAVAADYQALLARFGLEHSPELELDYVRVKLAFEATRDGGWWGLHWAITNEQPNSDKIWAAWQALEFPEPVPTQTERLHVPEVTAIAECDELSALFAFVARRLGLSRESEVGLLWPTGNHVVAVWTIHPKREIPVRVVVPTSQIFLDDEQSLATEGFNPWRQKRIYDYRRQDAAESLTIPGPLASAFVQTFRDFGARSQAELQAARNHKRERQERSLARP